MLTVRMLRMLRNAENAENADCDLLTTSPTDAITPLSQLWQARLSYDEYIFPEASSHEWSFWLICRMRSDIVYSALCIGLFR